MPDTEGTEVIREHAWEVVVYQEGGLVYKNEHPTFERALINYEHLKNFIRPGEEITIRKSATNTRY